MFDLIIRNGLTVTAEGAEVRDIAILGEQIAAVTAPQAMKELRAPMAPGNGGRSKPSRVVLQRVQVTSAMLTP